MIKTKNIERSYQLAKDRYTELGVATDSALNESQKHSHLPSLLAGR